MKEAKIYDARGNGDGKVCCSIVGGHQSSISDYTAIVLCLADRKGKVQDTELHGRSHEDTDSEE